MRWAGVLLAIAALVASRPAQACSCGFGSEILWPPDGAVDVPLNTVVVVDRLQDPHTLTIRDPAGNISTLDANLREPLSIGHLQDDLLPETVYVLEIQSSIAGPLATSSFTSGSARDDEPPMFAGIAAFATETQGYPATSNPWSTGCIASCVRAVDGHVSRIRFDHERIAEARWYEIALRREEESFPFEVIPLRPDHDSVMTPFSCTLSSPPLDPAARYCGRVTAFDGAGNAVGGEVELCSETLSCAPRDVDCLPVDTCTPIAGGAGGSSGCAAAGRGGPAAGWLVLLTLAASARPRRGPRSRP